MRIEPKTVTPISGYKAREQAPTTAKADDTSASSSVVKLSTASTAAATASSSTDRPGVTQRIAAIRAAVASGQYPIDLDKLASRIVDDEVNPRGST